MKKINIRNLIITLLCITVIILAIGYSVLAIRLDAYKHDPYDDEDGMSLYFTVE